eukprot:Hpha_TRINITY_DN16859_c2_g1::TRINITY_DN16859_c2_g1_i1::g.152560::m.152560
MRSAVGIGLLLVGAQADWPSSPPESFTADVTIEESGLTTTGKIAWDAVGKRTYEYNSDSEQTTIQVQDADMLNTLTYTVVPTHPSPTCVCERAASKETALLWYQYLGGAKNASGCSGGTLYTNPLYGYPGTGTGRTPSANLCLNGQTPVYADSGTRKITFKTFTAGRPTKFNMTALEPFLPGCAMNCNYGKTPKVNQPLLSKLLTAQAGDMPQQPADSFEADITLSQGGETSKGKYSVDAVARRSYMYHADSGTTKLVIQEDGALQTYVYTVVSTQPNPTCVCKRFSPQTVGNPWYVFLNGVQNSSGCSGGSLYTNPMTAYTGGTAQPPPESLCLNGATPVYTEAAATRMTFDTFTAGRPAKWNITALAAFLPDCTQGCNLAAEGETVTSELMRFPKAQKQAVPKKVETVVEDDWPQAPADSFSADVTFTAPGGLKSDGKMVWDSVARRAYVYHADSQQTKFSLQNIDGNLQTYVYSVVPTKPSPTCDCDVLPNTEVRDPWYIFLGGAKNSTGCSGGSLYTNLMQGFAGAGVLPPPSSLCMNGATPVYSEHGDTRITYKTFTAGRPAEWNTTALEQFLPSCAQSCNSVQAKGVFTSIFHSL